MNYVKSNGFGGGMIWAIDLDDYLGECGEKWPLLNTMNRILKCKYFNNEIDFVMFEVVVTTKKLDKPK